ncbi:MAG: glycosyl transferase [Candidatus Angelobacter sp. Gp1-AA117]|nr:MAG: glycosyl transferase [Candidatus Angelobacter sp. Gp1-AA117]
MPSPRPTRTFYRDHGKRIFDFICAGWGLLLLSPVLVVVALAVKCSSRGPVFFTQERVGKDGKIFRLWKFRSMVAGAERVGPEITSSGDERVTPVGRYLRKWKLDEMPQLWNVVRGDMSLVGPRPETLSHVQDYTPEQREVLSVRPGITDLAAIAYRHEEELLATAKDAAQFYREVVLPHKLSLNREYIANLSLPFDLRLIFRTFKVISAGPPLPADGKAEAQKTPR